MRIVIADDSGLVRERLVSALLEIDGVAMIGQVGDTMRVVESVQRLYPDVVIMDVMINGKMSFEQLYAVKRFRPIPLVVVFTNYASAEYRRRAFDAGADHFFAKDTEFKAMLQTMKKLDIEGLPRGLDIGKRLANGAK